MSYKTRSNVLPSGGRDVTPIRSQRRHGKTIRQAYKAGRQQFWLRRVALSILALVAALISVPVWADQSDPPRHVIDHWDANDSNCGWGISCKAGSVEAVRQRVVDNFHQHYGPLKYTTEYDLYAPAQGFHYTWYNEQGDWNGAFWVYPVCTDGTVAEACWVAPPGDAAKNLGSGGNCDGGEGSGDPKSCAVGNQGAPMVADPINSATGNSYLQETDFAGSSLMFRRFYNSDAEAIGGAFGAHWSHSFDRRLEISSATTPQLVFHRPDGKSDRFIKSNGTWSSDAQTTDTVVPLVDGSGSTIGYALWVSELRHTETYSSDGRLQTVSDSTGQNETFGYSDASTDPEIAPRAGLLLTAKAPNGRQLSFAYDANAHVRLVTLPDGMAVVYGYDTTGNLTSVQYPDGKSRHYMYNEPALNGGANLPGALTGIVDENGIRFTDTAFDGTGRAVSTQLAGAAGRVAIQYNADGSSDVTYPLGGVSHQGYTTVQGLVRVSTLDKPCGECGQPYASRIYDTSSRPATYTDFKGNMRAVTYDANGLLTEDINAKGSVDERTIDTTWNIALRVPLTSTVKDKSGNVVTKSGWAYNTSGQPTASCLIDTVALPTYTCSPNGTAPAGVRRTVMTYCTAVDTTTCPLVGLILKTDGPRTDVADTITYTYYLTTDESGCTTLGGACHHLGDLQSTTDGAGLVTTYVSYDKAGRVTRIKDPNGVLTDYTYTPRGWLATTTIRANASGVASASDAVTTVTYDPTGTVHSVKDPDGVTTTYTYDAAHRLTDITDALGSRIHYTLDVAGNRTAEQVLRPTGAVVRSLGRTYNALGQLTAITDGLNRTVFNAGFTDSYDGNGNLVHTQDALSVQQKQVYDGLNRLVSTLRDYQGTNTATANAQSVTSFDALDRVTGFSDADGLNTTYDFDGLGNATGLRSPDTGKTTRGFDVSGNPVSSIDAANVANHSTYDALNRLTGTTYTDTNLNVAYHYDEADGVTGCTGNFAKGRLTRVVEGSGDLVYCYDAHGNVVRKQQAVGTTSRTTTYAWSAANRLQSVTTPNGTGIAYTRNSLGQTTSIQATAGGLTTTVISQAVYQPFGPLASYTLGDGQTVTRSFDATGALTDIASTAFSLHVKRDAMGNVVALGDVAGAVSPTETYTYDSLYRLTGLTTANGANNEAYTYNKTGDRSSKVAPGLLTGTYSYASGSHHLTGVGSTTRVVDARGNTTADVRAAGTFGYGYNGRNRLTVVQNEGVTVGSYVLNALGQRVQKTAGGNTTWFDYDEDSQLLSESAGTSSRDYVWMNGMPVGIVDHTGSTASFSFVHADGLGSPRAITDATGSVLWEWAYANNAFGEKVPVSLSGYSLNFRYPGQYFDAESGLNYNVNRDYQPGTGRYIQSDPIGLRGGASSYAYSNSNPYVLSDAFGLSWAQGGAVVGCAVGGGLGSTVGAAGGGAAGAVGGLACGPGAPVCSIGGAVGGGASGWIAGGTAGCAGGAAVGSAIGGLFDGPQYAKPIRGVKPKNCPAGTKPIDQAGLSKDDLHGIKEGVHAGAQDWTGITPNGDVITGDHEGNAVNNGNYKDFLP